MFHDKEGAMAAELDAALEQKEVEVRRAQEALARAEEEQRAQQARMEAAHDAKAEAEEAAERERAERQRVADLLDAATAEAEKAHADRAQVEGEMRLVLRAMDAQKQAAARNMMQLNKIAQDWSSAINSPV